MSRKQDAHAVGMEQWEKGREVGVNEPDLIIRMINVGYGFGRPRRALMTHTLALALGLAAGFLLAGNL